MSLDMASPPAKEEILGFPIDTTDFTKEADCLIDCYLRPNGKAWLACINPHSCVVASEDAEFRAALLAADYLVPDGIGMVYASMFLGGRIRSRVTGSDVFFRVNDHLSKIGGARVFFLGSTVDTLTRISSRFRVDYPNLVVAGSYSPPFKKEFSAEDVERMVGAINEARPDILWVGLTAPKQEKWIHSNLIAINVRFIGAIGAAFDFYAGSVQRSPGVFQRAGLEWLPRLLRNPRRLWRRTIVSAPKFVWMVIRRRSMRRTSPGKS